MLWAAPSALNALRALSALCALSALRALTQRCQHPAPGTCAPTLAQHALGRRKFQRLFDVSFVQLSYAVATKGMSNSLQVSTTTPLLTIEKGPDKVLRAFVT